MTFIEVLQWCKDFGFTDLMWPSDKIAGCVSSASFDSIERRIEISKDDSGVDQFIIEIGRNRGGQTMAWIYKHARPETWSTDVHFAINQESALPPELQVPHRSKQRCFPGDPTEYEFEYEPYLCAACGLNEA